MRSIFQATAIVGVILCFALDFAQAQTNSPPRPTPTPPPLERDAIQTSKDEIDENDVIRVTTNLVTTNALVIGRDRKFIPNLRREDFQIFENGIAQPIASFASVDRPFDVALIIDNSRSTEIELRYIKQAAAAFIDSLRPNDRAIVITTDGKMDEVAVPTSDRRALLRSIDNLKTAGATRLYDAVEVAINRVLTNADRRRAVVLLTDGVDNDSRNASYESNLNHILRSGVLIYAVQFSTSEAIYKQTARIRRAPFEGSGYSRADYQKADAYLHQVADLTGTTLFPAASVSDLDMAVAQITDELHNEYTIGFYPRTAGKPGEVRRLEIRVNAPWLTVRARNSYSFGRDAARNLLVNKIEAAPLSAIESRSPFRGITESKQPLDARWICKAPFPPPDFVIVQEGYDSKCPTSTRPRDNTNAWLIRKPDSTEIICKGFLWRNGSQVDIAAFPRDYAVVGETNSRVCSASSDPQHSASAWLIKRPAAEDVACKGFPVPQGFVVVNERKAASCPPTSRPANAWVIVPKWEIERRRFWTEP